MSFKKFIQPTSLTFKQKLHIVDDVYSFEFVPDAPLTWRAGQHGVLEVKLSSGKTGRHMFSLSSAPAEKKITITTHWRGDDNASDYKKALWKLNSGDKAKLRGPVGPVYVRGDKGLNIFIAGGIGITPIHSMLVQAQLENRDLHATLLYANQGKSKVIFKNELEQPAKQLKNVEINHIFSPDKITNQIINEASQGNKNTDYYLSVPPKMTRQYKKILKDIGVPKSQIHSDSFMDYK